MKARKDVEAATEKEQAYFDPEEIQLLTYRLYLLKDKFGEAGINIDVTVPTFKEILQEIRFLALRPPDDLKSTFYSAYDKLYKIIFAPGIDQLSQKQNARCQWLIFLCRTAGASYQLKAEQDFFEFIDIPDEEWPGFFSSIADNQRRPSPAGEKPNGYKPASSLDKVTVTVPVANTSQLPTNRGATADTILPPRTNRETSVQRDEEKLRKMDPELDDHINQILQKLDIKNPNKIKGVTVPVLDRIFGINDSTTKYWEVNKKYIRRSGTKKGKKDQHPIFDITESVLIGYLAGNYIKVMSRGVTKDLREYIRKFVNQIKSARVYSA